jgi:hypothetical protein
MPSSDSPRDIALQKLIHIFGEAKAQALLERAMAAAGVKAIDRPDDLLRVARALEVMGGIVGAVGAMLSVSAVMLGAKG